MIPSKSSIEPLRSISAAGAGQSRPGGDAPEKKPGLAAGAEDDEFSLDFSHYVPPPPERPVAPAPAPAATGATQAPGKPALKKAPEPRSGAGPAQKRVAAPSMSAATPRDAPAEGPPSAAPATAPPRKAVPPAPAIAPVLKDVAVLFASGNDARALATMESAVRGGGLGAEAQRGWLMLLDLYQQLGRKKEFEALSLEFVVRFERSAPAWIDAERPAGGEMLTGGIAYCGFSGKLAGRGDAQFDALHTAASRPGALRVDFSKVESIDAQACAAMLEAIASMRTAGKDLVLTGEARLIALLDAMRAQTGRATDFSVWGLLFEVCRVLGLQGRFEEAAVDYAVVNEVSPPSWEEREVSLRPVPARVPGREVDDGALRLTGELTGNGEALAVRVRDWSAAHRPLVIDMSRTARIDVASATALLRSLAALHQSGVEVTMRGVRPLIGALFDAMGATRVARIAARR